jgi:effector-binding domain-containing protein
MSYACEIKEQAAQPVLSVRTRTTVQDMPKLMGEVFGAIAQYLGMSGAAPAGAPFAAYYNMDMQDLDIEMGFPVSNVLPGKDNIQASEMPAGKYGSCIYTGPYDKMKPAYDALAQFVQEKGYEATGVAYEVYLNDPETPPEKLQTQILFPLKS